jgi:predicted dehydrogenase
MSESTITPAVHTRSEEKIRSDKLTETGQSLGPRVLSVGIVGAGEIVSRIHLPVLSACAGIRVIYIADKNSGVAQAVAGSYKVGAVAVSDNLNELPRTDVVLLAVPVNARLPYYELFAERGTSVLAEKPLALCISHAEHVCSLYPGYSLACGFQRRSYASVALAKLIVSENWFGPLQSISISEGALTTKTGADSRFYDDPAFGGGVLMDLGCHSLDLAIYISGASEATPVEQRFVFDNGIDREVEARLSLRTAQSSVALDYFVTWLRPAKNSIVLRFENCTATLSCRPSAHMEINGRRNDRIASTPLLTMKGSGAITVYQAFYLEWMAFLNGVRNRQLSQFNALSCLPTIRAVDALYAAGRRNP